MESVIKTNGLTKLYGKMAAVNQLNLDIKKGTIYGFLGLNGAGKTTTMRMLLGMIKPTKGNAMLFGQDVVKAGKALWSKTGYMIESTYAYPNLTVIEYLGLFSKYYGLKNKQPIEKVVDLLQLNTYRNVQSRHLSLGNLQRLGLAKALMHNPELLILDEPVNGLDPSGIVEIRNLLKELSKQGTTILISSHLLGEISKIADTIGIIHQGVLIKELEAASLHQQLKRKLILNTEDNTQASSLLGDYGIIAQPNNNELEIIERLDLATPSKVARIIVEGRIGLTKLNPYEEELETYFLRTIEQKSA